MPTVLMVPVHLDALHLTAPVPTVAPTLPYAHLPHFVAGRAQNADVPYLAAALGRSASNQVDERLEPGIHLHWSMPDALTHDDGDWGLPRLPNRWIVRRDGANLIEKSWLIESDLVRVADQPAGPSAGIPWADEQRLAWLGRTRLLPADGSPLLDLLAAGDYVAVLDPFTVDIAGEITFAALYSRCAGVFGLHDADISGDVPAGLRYRLYGYHDRAADDPVVELATVEPATEGGSLQELLDSRLHWSTTDGTVERSVYYAVVDFPDGTPAEPAAGSDRILVALGNTTSEALAALETEHDPPLEEAVAAMHYLAEDGRIETDLQYALDEYRHTHGFHAQVRELRWLLRPRAQSTGDENQAGGAGQNNPVGKADKAVADASVAHALGQLVALQRRYDAAWRQIESLRGQLFDDWCHYLLSAYPREGTRLGDLPDIDDIREYVDANVLTPLDSLAERTGHIEWLSEGGDGDSVVPRVDRAMPGQLAHEIVEAWLTVRGQLAGAAGPGGARYDLVLAPGPRFWAPRELSVVLRGDAVEPSVRHGADGRLDPRGRLECSPLVVHGPPEAPAIWAQVFDALGAAFDSWSQGEEPWIGFTRARIQPWHPLVLEWALDFEALADQRPAGPARGQGTHPSDFLTRNFRHDPRRPELVLAVDDPGRSSPLPLSGWSVLTRGAQQTVSGAIRRYTAELEQHNAEPQPVVARLVALADRLESDPPVLSCTFNGLDDALLMRRRAPQLPVRDPLALPGSVYEAFARRVAKWVGAPPGSSSDPALELHPLRTGFIRLDQLRVIGNFGTVRTLDFSHVRLPSTFSEMTGDDHAFLPPRILQAARLQFRWLDATSVHEQESTDHPSTSPVHGWLVVDSLDARILVFDGGGTRLGSIERDGNGDGAWVPAQTPIIDEVMATVLGRLGAATSAWLDAFVGAMVEAQELIDPADAAKHRALSMLVSRPIAVARARLDIELAGAAPRSGGWEAFRHAMEAEGHGERDDSGLGNVDVPVRLGAPPPDSDRLARLDDGLLAFWSDGDDTLRTPKSSFAAAGLAPHDDATHPPQVLVRTGGAPVPVTMLLDPRGQVHAISGVLPTKHLGLDAGHIGGALDAMEISLRAGPILTRPGHVDHVEPSGSELQWNWVDDDGSFDEQPIEPLGRQAPVPASLELRDGFLRLRRAPGRD